MMPCIVSCGVAPRATASAMPTTPRSVIRPGRTSPFPPFWNSTSFTWPSRLAASRGSGPSGTQDAAGQGAGVLAVIHHHLAAHDHVVHALRGLHPARRAVGPVVRDLVLGHADAREVEHHAVDRHALRHETEVAPGHPAGGLQGAATQCAPPIVSTAP